MVVDVAQNLPGGEIVGDLHRCNATGRRDVLNHFDHSSRIAELVLYKRNGQALQCTVDRHQLRFDADVCNHVQHKQSKGLNDKQLFCNGDGEVDSPCLNGRIGGADSPHQRPIKEKQQAADYQGPAAQPQERVHGQCGRHRKGEQLVTQCILLKHRELLQDEELRQRLIFAEKLTATDPLDHF